MVPNPIFTVFGKGVYLYGVFIAIGILACLWVYFDFTKRKGMPEKVQDFTFFVIIAAIALGFLFAKLYQAIYDWIEKGTFDFYHAGITAMGGFIGGAAVFLLFYFVGGKLFFKGKEEGLHKKEFNKTFLVAPISITLAHGFGRIGCLMAGCCHGANLGTSYVFGGIWMKASDTGVWGYYVPTQLYEALFLFALCAVLTVMYFKKSNITMPVYLIAYGVWRIFIEIFRTDARGGTFLGLAPSQWQSIVFIAGGIAMLLIYKWLKIPFVLKDEGTAAAGEANVEPCEEKVHDAVEPSESDVVSAENKNENDKGEKDERKE